MQPMALLHAWSSFFHPNPLESNGTFPLVHSPSCWVAERDWFVEDEHLLLDPIFLDQVAPSHWLIVDQINKLLTGVAIPLALCFLLRFLLQKVSYVSLYGGFPAWKCAGNLYPGTFAFLALVMGWILRVVEWSFLAVRPVYVLTVLS
ncbi:unnamed protein product [Microthlaspi erraticum]|uniref:Uncharacterized protein n=1 Tax=Microthlaspi erraticum TaxID=1685480 RepID=A0A6D2I0P0_9BRAS|nr:unnamed protein product [Microthlaspi erraticum]